MCVVEFPASISPRSTLFPYTTLFRSRQLDRVARRARHRAHDQTIALQQLISQRRFADVRQIFAGKSIAAKRSDRKSTRLNSSHLGISYAVFCLKKKKTISNRQ